MCPLGSRIYETSPRNRGRGSLGSHLYRVRRRPTNNNQINRFDDRSAEDLRDRVPYARRLRGNVVRETRSVSICTAESGRITATAAAAAAADLCRIHVSVRIERTGTGENGAATATKPGRRRQTSGRLIYRSPEDR